jgi:hypothetical protein
MNQGVKSKLVALLRRVAWPLGVWLAALACVLPFWSHATPHLCKPGYWLSGDSGLAVYNAWAAGDGHVMYRDIFEYRTPLFFLLHGVMMRITGPSPSWNQWLTLGYVSAIAPILWATSVRLGARKLVAAAVGVATVGIVWAVWPFPFPHWLGWPTIALTAYSLVRAYEATGPAGEGAPDRGWLARAGVFATLGILSAQFFCSGFVAAATLAMAIFTRTGRWRALGWFVGAGVLTAVPVIIYLLANGATGDAVWDTFTFPTKYYYNGFIKGHYPLAGVVEYWQKNGQCNLAKAGTFVDKSYTASVGAIPALAFVGLLTCLGAAVAAGVRVVRRRRPLDGKEQALALLCTAATLALLPQLLHWSISDNVHIGMAAIMGMLPFAAVAARGPRVWRWAGQGLAIAAALLALFVAADRWQRHKPFQAKYRTFDTYVTGYANSRWLRDLSEPGDTIVNIPYGGWQYLTARRHSGLSAAFVFNDDKLFPPRLWNRLVADLRARQPALMVFSEKPLEQRFFRMDPTLKQRYFWNGLMWERREPPFPHDTLAPSYRTTTGLHAGDVFTVTQEGPRLAGVRARTGAPDAKLEGSVRGHRVWLRKGAETYFGQRGDDGRITGEWFEGGRTGKLVLEPVP